ncbi:metallophosphoesterase [Enterococcus villorum]|uniref:Metallophosphoesterase n=1 Tax=Enterococcus villorum TaxID=112904 RepID=A0A1V8YKN0_9ENTE|nr:DNA repair exonuclease [Enterococcus villorum]OQO67967.1 metallophosphoesterase [Enterococcus villorum]OQO73159.1 metallophosphoesterase [Enterococcus villorum]
MVKFIHAADLHMDRSFEGLIILDKQVQEKLVEANLKVLSNIIEKAILNEVDFVLLVGDSFHQNRPSLKIQKHFFDQIERLNEKKIDVFMIFGNHDYYQKERYWFTFPENVHLFSSEEVETKEFITKKGEKVAISGFSYQHQWIQIDKVAEFPFREAADYHIGMYHGEIGGEQNGNYAPFQPSSMQEKGYDYWALGHIHVPMSLNEKGTINYPGAPQGHTQKEQLAESILLVELIAGECHTQSLEVAEVYWKTKTISLRQAQTTQDVLKVIQAQLNEEEKTMTLLDVKVTDFDHLKQEVIERIQSGELLEYLTEKFTSHLSNLLIWRISIQSEELRNRIPLKVSPALITQIFESYQADEDFYQILSEMYSHSEAARLMNELPDYREHTLAKARELIEEDFVFEEETI